MTTLLQIKVSQNAQ